MTERRAIYGLLGLVGSIFAALLYIRCISTGFTYGTDTFDHPYQEFIFALIVSGIAWLGFLIVLPRIKHVPRPIFGGVIFVGVIARLLFLGSTPIYEDDWARYLWDGAVTLEEVNPYVYPPKVAVTEQVLLSPDIEKLQDLADEHADVSVRINNADLTTIYPPVATSIFTLGAWIKAFDLDVLRMLYLCVELLSLAIFLYILKLYGRNFIWFLLYWFNPMLIYAVYNALHMDVLLLPGLLGALALVKSGRPYLASLALGVAAAVKFWPLVLGPVLLRQHRRNWRVFIGGGIIMGLTCLLLILPLLLALNQYSGLAAYSESWVRSAFLFVQFESLLGVIMEDPGRMARICVAIAVTGVSLWLAFKSEVDLDQLPLALLMVILTLYLLSPTGYPWYTIWFVALLPLVPSYGAALLTVTVSLYYLRYALGERDIYHIYTDIIVPIQFGLPMLVMGWEIYGQRRGAYAR